ncbi:MAG: RNHCP domain-containing protein [Candidatus Vogelbacteria bacterium]|nr:RNHCP domain-containing protein [Candidatus Vogelbacteria bacterium]
MSQVFIKNEEDFICEHCGFAVAGNGYTNHCPKCLWSKHVDVNPGDRAATCGGIMRPVEVVMAKGEFEIVHRCEKCGYTKQNRAAKDDDLLNFQPSGGETAK